MASFFSDEAPTYTRYSQLPKRLRELKQRVVPKKETFQRLLGSLGGLGPKLHHTKDQGIPTDSKDHADTGIPPAVIVMFDIETLQEVTSMRVFTHFTLRSCIRVEKVDGRPRSSGHIILEVGRTRSIHGIEVSEFTRLAVDLRVPYAKREHASQNVGERIQVVHPVLPEDVELWLGYQRTTEQNQAIHNQRID